MNSFFSASVLLLTAVLSSACSAMAADNNRVVYETEIDADIDAVWNAFTTNDGLRTWMAPLVEIELAVGGKMKANYNAKGKLGDETTIENTILSFDPKRMLTLKATGFPTGFPFEDAAKATWSVFYFTELPSSRTKVTVVGLGYTDDEQSKKMRSFFATANKHSLDKLKDALKKRQEANSSEVAEEGGVKLTGAGIRELAGLPNLQDLSLERSAIDDKALKDVGELKELRELNLRKTKVSDEGLKHLAMTPELRELILQSTPITVEGLRHLVPCKSLRLVYCWGTDVTNEEIRELKEIMPNCEVDKGLIE